MFKNITNEMLTSVVAAVVALGLAYGVFNPEQGAAVGLLFGSVAVIALAIAKDPQ